MGEDAKGRHGLSMGRETKRGINPSDTTNRNIDQSDCISTVFLLLLNGHVDRTLGSPMTVTDCRCQRAAR